MPDEVVPRLLPPLNDDNRPFWTSGADGVLRIQHCDGCDRWIHPPIGTCPRCGDKPTYRPVSGRGTVFTFTVNEQRFHPDQVTPNLIAIVTLAEQADLRLVTNLVGCEPDDVAIDLPVQVTFERHGDVAYPTFTPAP